MVIDSINLIYFSPTDTTKKIIHSILDGLAINNITTVDLTTQDLEKGGFKSKQRQLNIIGIPVYGGRVPYIAAERFQSIKADKAPAIIIVLYGNREFEDALLELKNLVKQSGFIPIAAGAFIGEHSFSELDKQIAHGRPDMNDLRTATEFGKKVKSLINTIEDSSDYPEINVPGNFPYKELKKSPAISPKTNELKCEMCGICEDVCPTYAIQLNGIVNTEKEKCIRCCACIKKCTYNARYFDDEYMNNLKDWLYTNFSTRKEPETFLN